MEIQVYLRKLEYRQTNHISSTLKSVKNYNEKKNSCKNNSVDIVIYLKYYSEFKYNVTTPPLFIYI